MDCLKKENIVRGAYHVGDVMYDTYRLVRELGRDPSPMMERLGVDTGGYALLTCHRPENTDDPETLSAVLDYVLANTSGDIVFPVHPRTRQRLAGLERRPDRLKLVEPVGYFEMFDLLAHSKTIFTDSGGVQKEAYFHRVPCVTLYSNSPWIETIEHGWNRLWTTPEYAPRTEITEYGDGHSSRRITEILLRELGEYSQARWAG
jgi:UDP-GlcNAc3NAcA epimerase